MDLRIDVLTVEMVTPAYVQWFDSEKIIAYSDNQYKSFNLESQRDFVERCVSSDDISLFGIFDGNIHVGNICLNGLSSKHQRAELTYVIGDLSYWNKGVATYAIRRLIEIARSDFKLIKLYAGVASPNIGSRRVLEKNGFVLEGVRKNHLVYGGQVFDQFDYGLLI